MKMNSTHRKVIKFSYIDLGGAIKYWEGKDGLALSELEGTEDSTDGCEAKSTDGCEAKKEGDDG